MGLVTPETVAPILGEASALRDAGRRPPTIAASAAAWEGLDGTRLAAWADASAARKRLDRALGVEAPAMPGGAEARDHFD